MPHGQNPRLPVRGPGQAKPAGNGGVPLPLLRYTHIFASTVREVLEQRLLSEVSPAALTLSQFHLLKLMTFDGQHHVGEVAGFLGVSAPAATKNIDKLERLGLVQRAASPDDRRATLLSVSPRGRRLVERYEQLKRARLAPVVAGFAPEEIDQFAELLERFSVSLLAHEDAADGACLRCAAYLEAGCPVGLIRGGCPYPRLRRTRPSWQTGGTA